MLLLARARAWSRNGYRLPGHPVQREDARVVAEAAEVLGGLDGLVSNAGVNRPAPLVEQSIEDWD